MGSLLNLLENLRTSKSGYGKSTLFAKTDLDTKSVRFTEFRWDPFNGGSAGSIWDPRYSINSWIFWSSPISKYSINISIFPNRFSTVLERFPPVKPPKKPNFFSRASRAISPRAPEFRGTLLIFPKNSLNFKVLY